MHQRDVTALNRCLPVYKKISLRTRAEIPRIDGQQYRWAFIISPGGQRTAEASNALGVQTARGGQWCALAPRASGPRERLAAAPTRAGAQVAIVLTSERGAPFSTAGFARMVERAGVEARLGFKAQPHMLRHACGFALANKGHDTRHLQAIWAIATSAHGALYQAVTDAVRGFLAQVMHGTRKHISHTCGHTSASVGHSYSTPTVAGQSRRAPKIPTIRVR